MDNLDILVDPSHPDFTLRFLLDKLADAGQLGVGGREGVREMRAEKLATGGFLSEIYRLRVQFADGADQFTCIFKVPITRVLDAQVQYDAETYHELVRWMYDVHNAECRFYSAVAPLLRSAPVPPPFTIPEVFAHRDCPSPTTIPGGFLLMEDVGVDGAAGVDLFDGLSKEQTDSAVRALAHYHALCLWLPRDLVDSFTLIADLDFDDSKLHILERLQGMPDAAVAFQGQVEALRELYQRAGTYAPDQHKLFELAPVIVHGDYWSNNIFFRRQPNGLLGDQVHAVFDWQVCYSGTGFGDLLRIIFVGVAPDLRRSNLDHWIALYAAELNTLLDKLGRQEQKRSLELIRRIATHHCAYEMCFQIFLFSNILGGLKEQPKRATLITRMSTLFNDYNPNGLFGEKNGE